MIWKDDGTDHNVGLLRSGSVCVPAHVHAHSLIIRARGSAYARSRALHELRSGEYTWADELLRREFMFWVEGMEAKRGRWDSA